MKYISTRGGIAPISFKKAVMMGLAIDGGLLLPQVATEYNWDCLTFLKETCCKAGLPSHAWKDEDTKIFTFSADIFGSHESFI